MPMASDISERTCGNCRFCIESVRKDGNGFCWSNVSKEIGVKLKRKACACWRPKNEK